MGGDIYNLEVKPLSYLNSKGGVNMKNRLRKDVHDISRRTTIYKFRCVSGRGIISKENRFVPGGKDKIEAVL
jgi:hypothetical protein